MKLQISKISKYIFIITAIYLLIGSIIFWAIDLENIDTFISIDTNTVPYDLVIVFTGGEQRIPKGFEFIQNGKANKLIISPATEDEMNKYVEKYSKDIPISYILETNARTTHENAYYTAKIVKSRKAKKILLITSFYHMRRSYHLLSLALLGHDVNIDCYPISIKKWNSNNWKDSPLYSSIYQQEFASELLSYLKYLANGLMIRKNNSLEIHFYGPYNKYWVSD